MPTGENTAVRQAISAAVIGVLAITTIASFGTAFSDPILERDAWSLSGTRGAPLAHDGHILVLLDGPGRLDPAFLEVSHALVRLDPASGAVKWLRPVELLPLDGSRLLLDEFNDVVIVPTPDGLAAFDASTGTPAWTAPTNGARAFGIGPGHVLLAFEGQVRAINTQDGSPAWPTGPTAALPLAVHAGPLLILIDPSGLPKAVDAGTGDLRWSTPAEDAGYEPVSRATLAGDVVILLSDVYEEGPCGEKGWTTLFRSRYARGFDADDGRLLWRLDLGREGPVSPCPDPSIRAPDAPAATSGSIAIVPVGDRVIALTPSGTRLWEASFEATAAPLVLDDRVLIPTRAGVHTLEARTGNLIGSHAVAWTEAAIAGPHIIGRNPDAAGERLVAYGPDTVAPIFPPNSKLWVHDCAVAPALRWTPALDSNPGHYRVEREASRAWMLWAEIPWEEGLASWVTPRPQPEGTHLRITPVDAAGNAGQPLYVVWPKCASVSTNCAPTIEGRTDGDAVSGLVRLDAAAPAACWPLIFEASAANSLQRPTTLVADGSTAYWDTRDLVDGDYVVTVRSGAASSSLLLRVRNHGAAPAASDGDAASRLWPFPIPDVTARSLDAPKPYMVPSRIQPREAQPLPPVQLTREEDLIVPLGAEPGAYVEIIETGGLQVEVEEDPETGPRLRIFAPEDWDGSKTALVVAEVRSGVDVFQRTIEVEVVDRVGGPGNAAALGAAGAVALTSVGVAVLDQNVAHALALRRVRWWMLLPLYSRLAGPRLLEQNTRERIYERIRVEPGIHYRGLLRGLELSQGELSHHLHRLVRDQLVIKRRDGLRMWLFLANAPQSLAAVADPFRAAIIDTIKAEPGIIQSQVARKLNRTRQIVNYHIQQLLDAGMLRAERQGRVTRLYAVEERTKPIAEAFRLPTFQPGVGWV